MPPPKTRRIAIMGFRSVGKSSLTIQFVENQFVDSYDPTIENTFRKEFKPERQEYQMELIDTAGQDEHSLVPQHYSMNIDGYVLVYSITSDQSFNVVKVIYEKLLDMTGKKNLPLVLVGNKTDLRMEREVSKEDGQKLARDWNAGFLEVTAKENQKVVDIFTMIINQIEKAEGNVKEEGGCVVS